MVPPARRRAIIVAIVTSVTLTIILAVVPVTRTGINADATRSDRNALGNGRFYCVAQDRGSADQQGTN